MCNQFLQFAFKLQIILKLKSPLICASKKFSCMNLSLSFSGLLAFSSLDLYNMLSVAFLAGSCTPKCSLCCLVTKKNSLAIPC